MGLKVMEFGCIKEIFFQMFKVVLLGYLMVIHLITDANSAYMFEVTFDGNIVWQYDVPGNNIMVARAQKYGYDYFDNDLLLGDLNEDGIINILDVIATINIVLSSTYNELADLNQDNFVNVLDIVALVNIILR